MSYSFEFRAATKHEARTLAREHMNGIVGYQPAHAADRDIALEALDLYLGVLGEDDTRDIQVNMHGSLSWNHNPADPYGEKESNFTHASVGVSVHFVLRG